MEHLSIYLKRDIRDIFPYSDFIAKVRPALEADGVGGYLGDDMAIDGGDAEGVFACRSARALFEFIRPQLSQLAFMSGRR